MTRNSQWMRVGGALLALGALIGVSACGSQASGRVTALRAPKVARWAMLATAMRPLDLVGPLGDGSFVLAADARLWRLTPGRTIGPFASEYRSPGGEEPYVALSPGGCFGMRTIYALRLAAGRGVSAIEPGRGVRRFARLQAPGLIDGITFDTTGEFGHRLLVTIEAGSRTTLEALDCRGTVATITRRAPRVEGGIAVAPKTFGRWAGDLIASDENSGKIFAITPQGTSLLIARSGLPHGGDVGVESEGFVPAGVADAFVADRLTPGNPHPGDDRILRLSAAALRAAGVHGGELLVSTEGGALTDAVHCTPAGCAVRLIALGPAIAHIEGHIAFGPTGR